MSITLACYFPAEKPLFLDIEIPSNARVSRVLKAIEVKLHSRGREDVGIDDLRLFKADVPMEPKETRQSRTLQWLYQQPADNQLDEMKKLSFVFPNGPHGSDDKLDIIVADADVLEMVDALDDPYGAYNRKVKKALNKCLDTHLSLPSPSESVMNACMLDKVFGGKEPRIHIGRPGGAPAVIFNPALAALQQRFDHLDQIEVSPAEVSRAANYLHYAAKFYKDEDQRQDAIEGLITDAFGGTGKWKYTIDLEPRSIVKVKGQKFVANASWRHNMFLILVFELKNSLGLNGDALLQAVIDYSKTVSGDEVRYLKSPNPNPAVQAVPGVQQFPCCPHGCHCKSLRNRCPRFCGINLRDQVTHTRPFLESLGFHTSDNITRLARVFDALSRCREELNNYYRSVMNLRPPKLSCLFPNPTPIDPSKTLPKLTYRQFLSRAGQPTNLVDLGDATTAMYIASLDSQEVVVKFTARYNETAHHLLADAQLAPRLHFCGRVVGDLYMIVMDRVDGTSVWQLQQENKPIPRIVPTKVEEAVRLLHEQNIVFGDLRANNILYVQSGAEGRVVLVDFDWPGQDGQGKYPATLNPGTTWHKDVAPYGTMRKSHDLWQLARLKDLCIQYIA